MSVAMRHLRTGLQAHAAHAALAPDEAGRYFRAMITRRGWLAGGMCAALAFAARRAFAIGPGSRFLFGQLQLGGGGRNDLGPRPVALRRLAWEIEKRTSVDVQLEPVLQTPTSETLHETPFLYLSGERELELP